MKTRKPLIFLMTTVLLLLGLAACKGVPNGGNGQAASETAVFSGCMKSTPSPLSQSIVDGYAVTHEQVLTWFCSGFSYDNILIALETGEAVDISADSLLKMLDDKSWEEIWIEIGFTKE